MKSSGQHRFCFKSTQFSLGQHCVEMTLLGAMCHILRVYDSCSFYDVKRSTSAEWLAEWFCQLTTGDAIWPADLLSQNAWHWAHIALKRVRSTRLVAGKTLWEEASQQNNFVGFSLQIKRFRERTWKTSAVSTVFVHGPCKNRGSIAL